MGKRKDVCEASPLSHDLSFIVFNRVEPMLNISKPALLLKQQLFKKYKQLRGWFLHRLQKRRPPQHNRHLLLLNSQTNPDLRHPKP